MRSLRSFSEERVVTQLASLRRRGGERRQLGCWRLALLLSYLHSYCSLMRLGVTRLGSKHLDVSSLLVFLFRSLFSLLPREKLSFISQVLLVSFSLDLFDLLKPRLLFHLLPKHFPVVDLSKPLVGLLELGHLVHALLHHSQLLVLHLIFEVLFVLLRLHDFLEVLLEDVHLPLVGPVQPGEVAVLLFGFSNDVVLNLMRDYVLVSLFRRAVVPRFLEALGESFISQMLLVLG